jgi:hypothetical protein
LATGAVDGSPVLGRAAGNSVNALLDAWVLTSNNAYLAYAEGLIRRCVHPADDIERRRLLDVEKSWSYTVFLLALSKYLELKALAQQMDSMYGYARAALLHYAGWMLEHELPYFDQLEKLEFPTETWAAQEFRKANVLRLAARHADEPLRSRLATRGDELGDRAWSDLMRFDTRATARAMALVMTDGLSDCALRCDQDPVGNYPHRADFGPRTQFVSQRQRIKMDAATLRGAALMIGRLFDPARWRRYLRSHAGDVLNNVPGQQV